MVFALESGVKNEKSSSPPYHSITLAFCDSRLERRQRGRGQGAGGREQGAGSRGEISFSILQFLSSELLNS
jgi:hypothetical protein